MALLCVIASRGSVIVTRIWGRSLLLLCRYYTMGIQERKPATHEEARTTVCAACDVCVGLGSSPGECRGKCSDSKYILKGSQAGLGDGRREQEEPQRAPGFGSCAPA